VGLKSLKSLNLTNVYPNNNNKNNKKKKKKNNKVKSKPLELRSRVKITRVDDYRGVCIPTILPLALGTIPHSKLGCMPQVVVAVIAVVAVVVSR
jgi:hypothetical protein